MPIANPTRNADGTLDAIEGPDVVLSFDYDAEGFLIREEVALWGMVDTTDYVNDSDGHALEAAFDLGTDGVVDIHATQGWADGLRRTRTEDDDPVGDGQLLRYREYAYDSGDRIAMEDRDEGGDGSWDAQTTWDYDGDGHETAMTEVDVVAGHTLRQSVDTWDCP